MLAVVSYAAWFVLVYVGVFNDLSNRSAAFQAVFVAILIVPMLRWQNRRQAQRAARLEATNPDDLVR